MRRRRGRPRGVLATLYLYELRMLARDTRTLLIAVGAPLFIFPVMVFVTRGVERREQRRIEEATYRYAITGTEQEWARELVDRALALEAERDGPLAPAAFVETSAERPDSLVRAGELEIAIEGMAADEYERVRALERSADSAAPDEENLSVRVPVLRVHYRSDEDLSRAAAERMRERLERVRRQHRDSVYRAHGLPFDPDRVAMLESENVASAEREGGAFLGVILTPLLLFLMLSGGSIVAVDAITGEKERGTLETLLTTAARRSEIVDAKQFAVITVGVAVTLINVLNLLVYLVLGVIELPRSLSLSLSGQSLLVLLMLLLPLTVLVSSALLLLSGWVKSYKEYQMWFFPLFLAFFVPSLAGLLPSIDLRSAIAFVPVAGVAVAVREVMLSRLDWPFLWIAFTSTGLTALGAARLTVRALSTERLISGVELDEADLKGGPALFPRRVLRWFGILWVLLLMVSLWFGEQLALDEQVMINILGIFFVGSLLMVRTYRLDPVQAFALRAPPAAAWPAVLIGAPSALVTGIGLGELFQRFVPVPERVLREFSEMFAAQGLPLWETVLLVAIVPGIFEELAFRGVLLHGLSRRLRPVALAAVVGLVFGFFHVSLWRILPTAYLGVLLSAVVLLTGSIFPAMLWHALSNATAVVPAELGWISSDPELPLWIYPLALAGLATAFAILWATRRPYPGLWQGPPDRLRG